MIIYLYVKQCTHCGLKYFGKTKRNPYNYLGSGKYWKRHIAKHGKQFVSTLEVHTFEDQNKCTQFALEYSQKNNISESQEWANMRPENGLDGGDTSLFIDYHKVFKNRIGKTYEEIYGIEKAQALRKSRSESNSRTKRGVKLTEEAKAKRRHPYGPRSNEFKAKISKIAATRANIKAVCPHCSKESSWLGLQRWHFDRCKYRSI